MMDKDEKNQTKKEDDIALWESVTKDITPLKENAPKGNPLIEKRKKEPASVMAHVTHTEPPDPPKRLAPKAGFLGTDHRTQQRLKRGKIAIDARLDLHGMSQSQAYEALSRFIPKAYEAEKRCVLIITGKGLPRSGDLSLLERSRHIGILKRRVPEWLRASPFESYILDVQFARPQHGGDGALYILLRRKRS